MAKTIRIKRAGLPKSSQGQKKTRQNLRMSRGKSTPRPRGYGY